MPVCSKEVRIRRSSGGELVLERVGEEPRVVKPVRALPITEPNAWIGLLDDKGKPLHMVRSLKELDPDSRALLEAELERLYFLPKILRIDAISEEYGVLRLEVVTDKGPRSFEIRSREHIRFLPDGRILLRDLDGNRYEIPSVDHLDARGRMLAEVFL
jgi:hypothetical protein